MEETYQQILAVLHREFQVPVDAVDCHASTKEKIYRLKKIASHISILVNDLEECCRRI